MKKLSILVIAAAVAALFSACDPGSTEEIVLVNHTGHNLQIIRYEYADNYNGGTQGQVLGHITSLSDGDSALVTDMGGLGTTSYDQLVYDAANHYWGDSTNFAFEDGTKHTFVLGKDTVWGPYAFKSGNYKYEEKVNDGPWWKDMVLWNRLTYTITEEDYNRCKK